jgi:hypothetical protein
MYIQIRKYRLMSGSAENISTEAAKSFLPEIKKIHGFIDYRIIDTQDGNLMSISVFLDKSGVEASNRKALAWHRQHFSSQMIGPQEVIEGKVLVDANGLLKKAKAA